MRRWLWGLVLGLVLLGAAAAGAADQYGDAAGDGGGGPDIRGVNVTNDGTGVSFAVSLASELGSTEGFQVAIDTDLNAATGAYVRGIGIAGGYELLAVLGNPYGRACVLYRGNRTLGGFEAIPSSLSCSVTGASASIVVPGADLGGPAKIRYAVSTFRTQLDPARFIPADLAPDCGIKIYDLGTGVGTVEDCGPEPPPEPDPVPEVVLHRLGIRIVGKGAVTGTVRCATRCAKQLVEGRAVLLRATAKAGWRFRGWTGSCRGRTACSFSLERDSSVTATFVSR